MNIKGNLKYILSGTLVFLIIYMFLAAFPTGPSMYFSPVWTIDTATGKIESEAQNGPLEPFKLQKRFGFFTPEGKIAFSRETEDRSTVSKAGWGIYADNAAETEIFNPDGTFKLKIGAPGFAHLEDDRVYLFLPGGDGVRQYDAAGVELWTREHTAPITAFHSSPAGTILGYADGNLTVVKPDGSELFSFYPGGSDLEVILGAAISEDGKYAACVSGIERQRFLLIRMDGPQYKIVHHQWLKGDLRRQVYVDFVDTGAYAFFECAEGLGIVDTSAHSSQIIPIKGRLIAVGSEPASSLFTALTQDGQDCQILAIERPRYLVAQTRFKAKDAFLLQRGTTVYLGTDNLISRIDIRGIE